MQYSEAFQNMRTALARRFGPHRRLAHKVIAQVPTDKLQALQTKHRDAGPRSKYLQIEHHMQRSARHAIALGLHKSRPLRILDLGCGAGYFLAVARYLGHDVLGVDRPSKEIYNDSVALLELPRVACTIEPLTPLPDLGAPFDLITGHQVRFNFKRDEERWSFEEWRYFLDDCRSRLAPAGRIRFELNPGHTTNYKYMLPELARRLRELPGTAIARDGQILTVAT